MNKSGNLKADRYVTSECSVCGFPVVDTGINAYPSGYPEHTCSRCGLETRNCIYPSDGVRHTYLRKYELEIDKTEAQLINELLSEIKVNISNNILRVGTLNSPRYKNKNSQIIKKTTRTILENKLNICGIQEFATYSDFNGLEISKIPGAYNYADYVNTFDTFGNAILSHHALSATEKKLYNTQNSDHSNNDYSKQGYIKTRININGKNVSVYNTHFFAYKETIVTNQMKELVQIIKNDSTPYKLVVADFNSRSQSDYDLFAAIGLKPALDINNPNNNMQDGTKTLDNILFSSNIQLINSYKLHMPDYATDHDLACAELKLL